MSKMNSGKTQARWFLLATLVVGALPAFAACSRDDADADPTADATSDALSACSVNVATNTYSGKPDYWGTLVFKNNGKKPLEAVTIAIDVPSGVKCDDDPAGWKHTQSGVRCTYKRTSSLSIAPGATYTFNYSTSSSASFKAQNVKVSDPSCGSTGGGTGGSSGGSTSSSASSGSGAGEVWNMASMTTFTSYPDPGSEECTKYNGCTWAGQFAALDGKQTEAWVASHNIVAVHSKEFDKYKLKTLRLRKNGKEIDVVVYDECADSDCSGCCTENAQPSGHLIDVEKYTVERFGVPADGQVEWRCLDCK